MAKQRVCVLFGGASADHNASLRTAYSVLNGISKEQYEVVPIGITRAGRWLYYPGSFESITDGSWETDSDCCSAILSPDPLHKGVIKILSDGQTSFQRVDVVFSVLHGKYGEDGRIQGLCKLSGLPFVGSGLAAAYLSLDKFMTHTLLNDAGVKTAKHCCLERSNIDRLDEILAGIEKTISYPMYVKPSNCSSTIGANKAMDIVELKNAVKIAFSHHGKVIVEEQLVGREIECAIIGNNYIREASVFGEIITCDSMIDNENSYIESSSSLVIPAEIDTDTAKLLKCNAIKAFKALGCKGMARIDFTLRGKEVFVRKVKTIPGLAEENIFPQLVMASGYTYSEMLDKLITIAIEARS